LGWRSREGGLTVTTQITKMLGRADQGFVDISAIALNAGIRGSIFALPEACFVMMMAFPFGSTRALATAHKTSDADCSAAATNPTGV